MSEVSLFANETPAVAADSDTAAVELGLRFRSDVAGTVNGIRFFKGTANTGAHVGHLWTSGGSLLATVTFTSETASGWQSARFSTPVSIQPNVTYVASYHTDVGRYAATPDAFATAGVDRAPLHALRDNQDGRNSVYHYGAEGFPDATFGATNYFVDVLFQPSSDGGGACGATTIASVTASGNDGNVPANVLDGNLATRWSNLGNGSYIQADLGGAKSVCSVAAAWYVGNTRTNNFQIMVSTDGMTFTQAFAGRSSGTSTAPETYSFTAASARYVRIVVNGNSVNDWASLTELSVSARSATAPPTPPTTPPTTGGGAGAGNGYPYPNATSTGVPAGTVLTSSGDLTITVAGTVIDSKLITGCVNVQANNVTIKNSKVLGGGCFEPIHIVEPYKGLIVQDTEIDGQRSATCGEVIGWTGYTLIRVNAHGCSDGPRLEGAVSITIQDSYLHDLSNLPGDHGDGIQAYGLGLAAGNAVTITHNTIEGGSNAAIFTADNATGDLIIDGNLLMGSNYPLKLFDNRAYVRNNLIYDNADGYYSNYYGPFASFGGNASDPGLTIVEWTNNHLTSKRDGSVVGAVLNP